MDEWDRWRIEKTRDHERYMETLTARQERLAWWARFWALVAVASLVLNVLWELLT